MKKGLVLLVTSIYMLSCLTACGNSSGGDKIPKADYSQIEDAAVELADPILSQYDCTISDVSIEKETDDGFTFYDAIVSTPELSGLSVADKANIADQIEEISTSDIENLIGKDYDFHNVISVEVSSDNGRLLFVELDGKITLFEGDSLLIGYKTWSDIDSTHENDDISLLQDSDNEDSEVGDIPYDEFKRYVNILGVETSEPNSAGGVDATVKFKKTNLETEDNIKYMSFWIVPYNAVDDIEYSEIGNKSKVKLRVVGPIETNENNSVTFDCVWYNNVIDHAEITRVEVEYMDGTVVSCSDSEALN